MGPVRVTVAGCNKWLTQLGEPQSLRPVPGYNWLPVTVPGKASGTSGEPEARAAAAGAAAIAAG